MSEVTRDQAERFPRRTLRRQNTRKRILRAATRLFQHVGYGHTTMNAIAKAADVHVTTLFTHFKSKQDMAASANEAALERMELLIGRSRGKTPFFEFFRNMVMDVAGKLHGEREPALTVWSELERDPDLALAWASYQHRQVVMLAGYVAADHDLAPDSFAPMLVAGLMVSAAWEAHRRWSADSRRLNLKKETLAALEMAERMAKAALQAEAQRPARAKR
ncbi:MAG: TetR family transcriptional regulator [Micropepsaceae bacterium]